MCWGDRAGALVRTDKAASLLGSFSSFQVILPIFFEAAKVVDVSNGSFLPANITLAQFEGSNQADRADKAAVDIEAAKQATTLVAKLFGGVHRSAKWGAAAR